MDGYVEFDMDHVDEEEDLMQQELMAALAAGDYDDPPEASSMDVDAPPAQSALQALNKMVPSSSSGGGSSGGGSSSLRMSNYSSSYEKTRNPTTAEFALELQQVRHAMLVDSGATDAASTHAQLNVTEMVTQRPLLVACDARKHLLKFCEDGADQHVACVVGNGARFYLRRRQIGSSSSGNISGNGSTGACLGAGTLLSKPMAELQREADRIQTEVLATRRMREEASRNKELFGDGGDEAAFLSESTLRAGASETALWVDKYAPHEYTALLSEEKLNREVLAALQAWAPYVFRADKASSTSNVASAASRSSGGGAGGALGAHGVRSTPSKTTPATASGNKRGAPGSSSKEPVGGGGDAGGSDSDEEGEGQGQTHGQGPARQDLRPFFKAVLICGPPGTGKTTLAHVVAKHCGYRPFEVNASDDRSHDVLKDTLLRAMHGNTVTGDRQPNCIILDEIDGIDGKNSIDMLVKMIRAPLRSPGGQQRGGSKGQQSSVVPVTRPIICICNDQYAPSLRELRRNAKVFVFRPPSEQRLVSRLQGVCTAEKIVGVARQSLSALCLATGNDIRSAINTLQFAALRTSTLHSNSGGSSSNIPAGRTPSFGHMLSSMINSGLKDVNRDAFQVWREIFSVREMALAASKRKSLFNAGLGVGASGTKGAEQSKGLLAAGSATHKFSASVQGPLAAVQAMADFGDSSLILSGIFHNILTVRYNDPSMTRSHLAADWISAVDQFDCFASGSGGGNGSGGGSSGDVSYQLMPYISSVAGAVHAFCSSTERVKVQWPSTEKDAFFKRKSKNNILEALVHGARLGSPCMQSLGPTILDVLSFLIDVISPRVRPVSVLTLSPEEHRAMQDCICVMAAVGLSYASQEAEGPYSRSTFSLDPAIGELVSFKECDELRNRYVPIAPLSLLYFLSMHPTV